MPGLHKINNDGIRFLCELYRKNQNMPFTQMLSIYNNEASKRGWRCLRSSGTIGYHLTVLGFYERGTRAPKPIPNREQEIITLGTDARKIITETFKISGSNLSLILRRKRNGKNADAIRDMALKLGGKLFVRAGIEIKSTKILDSKGNIEKAVTIK